MIRSCLTLGVALSLFALPAHAGDNDCGGIELETIADCGLESGCQADCNASNLVAACNGQCDDEPAQACLDAGTSACPVACSAGAGGAGGDMGTAFDCAQNCQAECLERVNCNVGDGGDCEALVANCDVLCGNTCRANAAANCETQCTAGYAVACAVTAQRECLVACDETLEPICRQECGQEDGALFCDGHYISADNLPACNRHLSSTYGVTFSIDAPQSFDASCAVSSPGQSDPLGLVGLLGLAVGVGIGARRRR